MAKYEKAMTGKFEEVLSHLENDIRNSAMTMNLVDESNYSCGDIKTAVRVYDKYFMRNKSRASLNLTIIGSGTDIFISAIGAGGGAGIIFNFSLGAEDNMVNVVRESVERIG
ncbi:hypothetical protein Amet_1815 [Alkaliphilus metalliredigens QYMF]|uniref:Uncharacterized protein n=1 Tax=Alkaliphilus metalliredigens (strain QYMF) TaxID=293826 RepID=A6TP67_ALKMQ|nr:DUF6054 family protein [Alkaliphilus metalliredigens]ABR47985.1 hypothetical protein Amet_1815 [Alkaliphilus metalliredigens QYMF]